MTNMTGSVLRPDPLMDDRTNGGLKPLPIDRRDFALGAVFDLPKLSDIPEVFALAPKFPVKHQRTSDFCSAFTAASMAEYQDDVEFEPSYNFAKSKEISGDINEWGQDMRSAMKAGVKFGFLPKNKSPESLSSKSVEFLRDPKNWDRELDSIAAIYKKSSFFVIEGQYNSYDNIRAAIYRFKKERQVVAIGLKWAWPLSDTFLEEPENKGYGHMLYAYGWNGDYLLARNSYGSGVGDVGTHLIHKDVINHWIPFYGSMMMVDLPRDTVETYQKYGIKNDWSWWRKLLQVLYYLVSYEKTRT